MPKISIRFEPRDLWVGVFWDMKERSAYQTHLGARPKLGLHIYLCLFPFFPIEVAW